MLFFLLNPCELSFKSLRALILQLCAFLFVPLCDPFCTLMSSLSILRVPVLHLVCSFLYTFVFPFVPLSVPFCTLTCYLLYPFVFPFVPLGVPFVPLSCSLLYPDVFPFVPLPRSLFYPCVFPFVPLRVLFCTLTCSFLYPYRVPLLYPYVFPFVSLRVAAVVVFRFRPYGLLSRTIQITKGKSTRTTNRLFLFMLSSLE